MENDFYIDKPLSVEQKKERSSKPLTGVWWKYGLALAAVQLVLWILSGYKISAYYGVDFSILVALRLSYVVYGIFILLAIFPFAMARIGLKRLMWFALVGYVLGLTAYYLLLFYEPTRRLDNLLPFFGFVQITTSGISLGIVWELGRYVLRKLKEK